MTSDPVPPPVPPQVPPTAGSPSIPPGLDEPPLPEVLPSAVALVRAGALWSALTVGFLVLIVLLIFITQNTDSAEFAFLGWHWSLPLGVAILLAAVCGGLLTVAVGTARLFQLRRAAKRNLRAAM